MDCTFVVVEQPDVVAAAAACPDPGVHPLDPALDLNQQVGAVDDAQPCSENAQVSPAAFMLKSAALSVSTSHHWFCFKCSRRQREQPGKATGGALEALKNQKEKARGMKCGNNRGIKTHMRDRATTDGPPTLQRRQTIVY